MCGIFGAVLGAKSRELELNLKSLVKDLLTNSEIRGQDSSGVAVAKEDKIRVVKHPFSPSEYIYNSEFNALFTNQDKIDLIIGHARMQTDGSFRKHHNNQPIVKDGIITVHNGILVNHESIWNDNKSIKREYEVDSEVINSLIRDSLDSDMSLVDSLKKSYQSIEGSFSTATILEDYNCICLATNTGSLYLYGDYENDFFIFASEKVILEKVISKINHNSGSIKQLSSGKSMIINQKTMNAFEFNINKSKSPVLDENLNFQREIIVNKPKVAISTRINSEIYAQINDYKRSEIKLGIEELYGRVKSQTSHLRRCSKCILPETFPFIEFNSKGICNYCLNHEKHSISGKKPLKDVLRNRNGSSHDCIIGLSGGRDSCHSLHYVVNELHLKPLAFTYDWGMVTDLARRNIARLTGKLGVEHISISANIQKKRNYIRKNILAWFKRPNIGTIPLFMAGDKKFIYHANRLMEQYEIENLIWAENPFETTHFKQGFSGIPPNFYKKEKSGDLASASDSNLGLQTYHKFKLAFYYLKSTIENPKYLNSSVYDSLVNYVYWYFYPRPFVFLYDYIQWKEDEIVNPLLENYDWEIDNGTASTWRIGDGTAALYNLLYYLMSGFTEHDTFRSNQIRENQLSRKEALALVELDNLPRIDSLLWYSEVLGIDFSNLVREMYKFDSLDIPINNFR